MIGARVTKDRYTIDPLYQWDKNQVLQIYGLSLPTIPEIHFSNKTMNNAIVKQASMDKAGVVSVDIPNSLLEQSHDILVYICTYEGDALQCLYKMVIPVHPKKKPDDYITPPDNTDEVYSYNALENLFVNAIALSIDNYEKAKADYQSMSDEISKATKTLETATEALSKATVDFDTAKSELAQAKEILEDASGDLTEATANYAAALEAYNQSTANLDEVVIEYNNAKTAYEDARALYEQYANSFLQLSGGTMTGVIDMGGKSITNVADPENDTDAVNKAYVDNNKSGGFAYNYAHNSDFTQFVAQAGIGGNHGTHAYAGDRWILDSGTVSGDAREDGNGYKNITLNGTIRQIVANAPDVGTATIEMVSGTADISYANGEITITGNGGVIKNVRLFEGNYTADNLPEYQPKGYGAELAECLRYFEIINSFSVFSKANYSQTHCYLPAVFSEKRVKPTIAVKNLWSPGYLAMEQMGSIAVDNANKKSARICITQLEAIGLIGQCYAEISADL